MEYNSIQIRTAAAEDAWELLKIYKPYVKKTAITFEYDVPTPEEFKARIENTLKKYPYLVAEKDGELLGYVYTGPFVGRAAYGWAAEVSIYLKAVRGWAWGKGFTRQSRRFPGLRIF